jgi:hypothetical protein
VNINYAQPDLLAVMPGMNRSIMAEITAFRPFQKVSPQMGALNLNLNDAVSFTLIAHGRAASADFERVVRAKYLRDDKRPMGLRLLAWRDMN